MLDVDSTEGRVMTRKALISVDNEFRLHTVEDVAAR